VPIFAAHFGNFGLAKFPTGTPQIPKFEVDIWGNFYVVDQKA
jgi:hypothetical protein